jgi:transposase
VSAISDIVGMSGRRILKAIIAGETNAMRLTELGSTRLKCSRSELAAALDGRVTTHHRFLIDHHLGLIEELERHISAFDARIGEVLAPFRDTVERLITTPGVGRGAAEVILAEIGPDMSAFPTAGHLLSWAGVVPRLDESAGKRRSTRVRHGAPWLKPVLVQCAWGAARAKGTYLQAQFFRLKARRGPKKAAIAVGASILTAVYHMLKDGTFYQDLGADYLVKRDPARTVAKLARRIKDLGFDVQYRATA